MSIAGRTPAPSSPTTIAMLIAVASLNPLSVNIIVPAMTAMAAGLGTDFATIQLTLSAYLFATSISQLVHGPLSDRFGRRPILLAGTSIYILASLLCLFATTAWVVIVGRILQGVGASAGFALGRAIVRDLYEREKAASMLGYVTMGFATAPLIAPLIGGLITDNLGWRLVFVFMTIISVILLAAIWFLLPETRRPMPEGETRPGFFQSFRTLARIPAFWAYALHVGFNGGMFFTFLGGTPFVATTTFGMTGTQYGTYFAMVPLAFIFGNFLTARFSARLGIWTMIVTGSSIGLLASITSMLLLSSGWQNPFALFGPMYAIGLANGLTMANGMAGAISVRPMLAGAASGITGSFQIGFGAIATVIIAHLLTTTEAGWMVGLQMGVCATIALSFAIWSRWARST